MIAFFNTHKPLAQSQSTLIITVAIIRVIKCNVYKYKYFITRKLTMFNIHKLKYCAFS